MKKQQKQRPLPRLNNNNNGVSFPVFFTIVSLIFASTIIPCAWTGFACMENPCMNGICIDSLQSNSSHQCYCRNGFTGYSCQINWDECRSNPCLNGGSCVDGIASFNCSCPENYAGVLCEVDLSVCEEAFPCQNNGTCALDTRNVTGTGFICSCPPGFTGHQCEIDISVCNATENVCQNGGKCVDGIGTRFYCECEPGWSGETCHIDIDECSSQPCLNGGICVNKINDFSCACPFGFTGRTCERKLRICKAEDNPCLNRALCLHEDDDDTKKTCYCVPDFHGTLCELRYDDCDPFPKCFNGGTCIDGVGEFSCSCPPDFFGPTCQCTADNATEPECVDYVNTTALPPVVVVPPSLSSSVLWPGLSSDNVMLSSSLVVGWSESDPLAIPTATLSYPFPGDTISVSLASDLNLSADLQTSIGKDIVPSSPAIPSPSPYDPGGGGEGRDDLNTTGVVAPFPESSAAPAVDDSSFPILPPTLTYVSPPPSIVITSAPVEASSIIVSPTPVLPPDGGGTESETVMVYEPSSTIRLDGSEDTVSFLQPFIPGSSILVSTPPGLLSSEFLVSPQASSMPDESTTLSPPLFSSPVPPAVVDSESAMLIPSDTTKVEIDASPSVDIISTGAIPQPPDIHTVDLTAYFPPVSVSTSMPDDTIKQTDEFGSPVPPGLTPTPALPDISSAGESDVVSQSQGEVEQSMMTPTLPPLATPTLSVSLLPSPSESVPLVDSVDFLTSSSTPDQNSQFPPSPQPSQTPAEVDESISAGTSPPVVSLTPVIGVTSDDAVTPEPTSAVIIAPPHIQPSSSILVDSDYDTISIIMTATIGTTPVQVIPTPTVEVPDSSASPTPPTSDITTIGSPTTPSSTPTVLQPNLTDPCENYCQNNARCIADSIEPICLCSFKYTGNQCEILRDKFRAASFTGDSFLSFRVPNDSVISKVDTRSTLVTIVPEGVLLYTGVGRMYALIFTQNGHVTLHFSCGSQSMNFVETRTRVDNGFNFTLDFRMEMIVQGVNQLRCSAEVSVNQSYIMKGEQVVGRDGALVAAERPIETVYLGGIPPFHSDAGSNDDLVGILPGFRGCLHNLMVNQEHKDIFEDALDGKEVTECSSFGCVANPCHGSARCVTKHTYPFWECLCPQGYIGHRCQIIVCSANPCQNGATCTYSQESLDLLSSNGSSSSSASGGEYLSMEDGEPGEFTTLSPAIRQQLQPVCLCPLGFSGSVCQQKINVTKPAFRPQSGYSSYMAYDPIPRFIDWFQLKFHFVTKNISQISLLLYSGNDRGPQPLNGALNHQNNNKHHRYRNAPLSLTTPPTSLLRQAESNNHMIFSGFDQAMADAHPEPVSDFFAITFLQGFVALTWNLGSGTQRITTPSRIDNRLNIHTLFAGRSGRQAWLKVDGMRNVTGKTPGPLYRLNAESNELYIGGYKSYKFEGLSHDLPLHQGFQGCIFDLGFRVKNRLYLPRPLRGRNVKNCFEEDC